MKSPFTGGDVILKKEKREMTVRKEQVEITYHFYQCIDTNEQFTTDELDNINILQAFNGYRARHSLPFPEDIKSIRENYGLSATKMSEILGFGANVYRNYEAGEIPNQSNARLIQMAMDPLKFKELLNISGAPNEAQSVKTSKKIENLIDLSDKNPASKFQSFFFGQEKPTIFSGYKSADFKKFAAMVSFFSQRFEPWKTKLNKLLFYSDFLHFRKNCFSLSGLNYRAIDMGPVPNNFNIIFDFLERTETIRISRTEFPNGGIGEQFFISPDTAADYSALDEHEMQSLQEVADKIGNLSSEEIINLSHTELAWRENFEAGKRLISYDYSFNLSAI